MDKTFKQRLEILPIKNIEHPVGNTKYYAAVHVKSLIAQADEEFQELKSKIDWLNNLLDERNEEVLEKVRKMNEALPVVPECVGIAIESLPDDYSAFEAISLINAKIHALPEENKDWLPVYNWLREDVKNKDIFALAFITGKYEVEKPQLFYLKNKITKAFLYDNGLEFGECDKNCKDWEIFKTKFTQQEIDSMQTGSYEQIEVAE